MTHDGLKLEARVKEEIGADPNGNIVLADAIRCQQQYGLPLFNGSDSSIVFSSSFLMLGLAYQFECCVQTSDSMIAVVDGVMNLQLEFGIMPGKPL